jgi:hypothetical protein
VVGAVKGDHFLTCKTTLPWFWNPMSFFPAQDQKQVLVAIGGEADLA